MKANLVSFEWDSLSEAATLPSGGFFQKWQECCMATRFCQQTKSTFTLATFGILQLEQTKHCKAQCFGDVCLHSVLRI